MGIFRKKDDMGNKGRGGKGPKPMHRGRKYDNLANNPEIEYMPIADREKMTDEEYYDRGDYERSYGPQKYGHAKEPHAAQKRMGDMVAKVYGKAMPPSQQRDKTKAEKKQEYTTSGNPENLYTESGEKVNTMNIDEGNLSAIKRVHRLGEHVTVQDDTERFGKGTKLFLKNPMGPKKYGDPAMNRGLVKKSKKAPDKKGVKTKRARSLKMTSEPAATKPGKPKNEPVRKYRKPTTQKEVEAHIKIRLPKGKGKKNK
tara:strand:+ start:286 stop:1053 length:768 start_codon:yes stop_codon:yes gene_type:complete